MTSNLCRGKRSFKPYQNEHDSVTGRSELSVHVFGSISRCSGKEPAFLPRTGPRERRKSNLCMPELRKKIFSISKRRPQRAWHGYVQAIADRFSWRHKKLSGIVWTSILYGTLHFKDRRGPTSLQHRKIPFKLFRDYPNSLCYLKEGNFGWSWREGTAPEFRQRW